MLAHVIKEQRFLNPSRTSFEEPAGKGTTSCPANGQDTSVHNLMPHHTPHSDVIEMNLSQKTFYKFLNAKNAEVCHENASFFQIVFPCISTVGRRKNSETTFLLYFGGFFNGTSACLASVAESGTDAFTDRQPEAPFPDSEAEYSSSVFTSAA